MDYIVFLTILFIDVVFIAIAYGVNEKNAKLLLAGYNTMSEQERKNFDLKSIEEDKYSSPSIRIKSFLSVKDIVSLDP